MSNFHQNSLNLYLAECASISINESDLLEIDLSTALHKRHKVPKSYLEKELIKLFRTTPNSDARKIATWYFAILSGGAYTTFNEIYSSTNSKCKVLPYWNIQESDIINNNHLATNSLTYDSFCLDEPINLFTGPAIDNLANGNSIDLHFVEFAGNIGKGDFVKASMLTESRLSTPPKTPNPSQGVEILETFVPTLGRGRSTSVLSVPQTRIRSLTPVSQNIQQNIAQHIQRNVAPQPSILDLQEIKRMAQASKLAGINHFNDLIKNLEVKNPIDNSEIKKTTIYKRLEVTRNSWNHCMQIMINEIDSAIGALSITYTHNSATMND